MFCGHPASKRWCDAFINEELDWLLNFGLDWIGSVDELEFAKVTESVYEILHLVHHDQACVVVAVAAQDA